MVVHDFDVVRITFVPTEAQPPLIVDSDGVLPFSVALEGLQSIPRQTSQIVGRAGRLENR
jgi:hypothetical protein